MEKISGILPATARVTTVDLKSGGAARSGAPSFGREVGVSSIFERRMAKETAPVANQIHQEQLNIRNTVIDPKAEIVQRMSDNFFMKKNKSDGLETKPFTDEASDMRIDFSRQTEGDDSIVSGDQALTAPQDDGGDTLAVGQYLDVRA